MISKCPQFFKVNCLLFIICVTDTDIKYCVSSGYFVIRHTYTSTYTLSLWLVVCILSVGTGKPGLTV